MRLCEPKKCHVCKFQLLEEADIMSPQRGRIRSMERRVEKMAEQRTWEKNWRAESKWCPYEVGSPEVVLISVDMVIIFFYHNLVVEG